MFKLFRAEWWKANGHRWLAGFLIWIFPIGAAIISIITIISALSTPKAVEAFSLDAVRWTNVSEVWSVLSDFPGSVVLRMPILAFVAVLFAGEFEWGTWKNLLPHNRRYALIINKFITLGIYVITAFVATSIIIGVGNRIATAIVGLDYGPKVSAKVLTEFIGDYWLKAGLAFISTLIVAGFSALAALLTRRILGGVLVGFVISVVEPNTLLMLVWLSNLFDNPNIIEIYRYMPTYSIGNIYSWLKFNHAYYSGLPIFSSDPSLTFSLIIVLIWAVGLMGLVTLIFQNQDITS